MGWLITFFKWLWELVAKAAGWLVRLPAAITVFFLTLISSVTEIVSFLYSDAPEASQELVSNVSSIVSETQSTAWGNLLGYCFALDYAWYYVTSCLWAFLGFVGLLFTVMLSGALAVFVVPWGFRMFQKLLSLFTGGFVKT